MSDVNVTMKTDRGKRCEAKFCCKGLLFVWVSLTFSPALFQGETVKACPGGKNSTPLEVNLSCPAGEVLSLGEAILGWNKLETCIFTQEDCKVKTDVFQAPCEGQRYCSVVFQPTFLASCGYYAIFIGVSYDCNTATVTILPTTIAASSPSTAASGGNVEDGSSGKTTTAETYQPIVGADAARKTNQDNNDNIALIVGCVLAVVVTVVLLIIAIVMVVRRLACNADLSEDDVEKKPTACNVLPCATSSSNDSDHGDSVGSSADKANNDTGSMDSENGSGRRKRKQCCLTSDRNQNRSQRLAPVGQEDEHDDGGDGGAAGTSTSERSLHITAVKPDPAFDRSSWNGKDHHRLSQRDMTSMASNSSHNTGGCGGDGGGGGGDGLAKPSVTSESPLPAAHRAVKRHSSGARVASGDVIHHEVAGSRGSKQEDMLRGAGTDYGEKVTYHHAVQKTDLTGRAKHGDVMVPQTAASTAAATVGVPSLAKTSKTRPKYDAVALPNTESVTSC